MYKIQVDHLSKSFNSIKKKGVGRQVVSTMAAIDDVTFGVEATEFLSIVGPSGCGKTTLLRMVAGLEKPDRGEVRIDGERISGPSPKLCMVFQDILLLPWKTVRANIELGLRYRNHSNDIAAAVDRYIDLVGLKGFESYYPHQLSGGMQQRVGLARALAVELAPKLLGKVIKKGSCAGVIVETEAYTTDLASHAYTLTPRSRIMRDTYGHWYVYFTYGMHWCANVTTNKGTIGAVLIRAVEPIEGIAAMKRRRNTDVLRNLCSGPAKFCQAFGITGKENDKPATGDFAIYDAPELPANQITASVRIGINGRSDLPWRFFIKDNPFVSR